MPVDDTSERISHGETAESVTRRHVLRRALVLGIAAPVAMAVLQACGGSPPATPTATKPPATTAPGTTGTPKPGTAAAGGGTPKATPKATPKP